VLKKNLLLLLAVAVFLVSCGGGEEEFDPTDVNAIVARVGDTILTKRDVGRLQLEAKSASMLFPKAEMVINDWIRTQLILQEARRQEIDKEDNIAWVLERQSLTILRGELFKRDVLDHIPEMTEADAIVFYEENKETFRSPSEQVWCWIIEREDEASAWKVVEKLNPDGSNFRAVAQVWSLGPSQPKGGDRGYLNSTRLKPELWAAANAIPLGKISAPIPYDDGNGVIRWAVILIKDHVQPGDYLMPEGVGYHVLKDRAFAEMYRQREDEYMDSLQEQTSVYIDADIVAAMDAYNERTETEIEDPTPSLD